MLASRMEILTKYHTESIKKMGETLPLLHDYERSLHDSGYLSPEKKLVDMDTENKITRKHMKRLRKQLSGEKGVGAKNFALHGGLKGNVSRPLFPLSAYQVMQKKKNGEWWDVKVRTSDYDSYVALSRVSMLN